jgi:uncharacterized protein YndB with AHSA1/START domain
MLKIILIVLGLVALGVVGLVLYASTKPDSFIIQRSVTINAPPGKIYPLIADFRAWSAWSPFEKLDPAMKRTFGQPSAGKGATYSWEGNSKAGAGGMTITEADPSSRVVIALDFTKPFATSNTATFVLEPAGEATRVTWAMTGKSPLMFKVMDTLLGMDKTVGKDFARGLADLKVAAEK